MTNPEKKTPRFIERFRYAYLFFLIVSAVMLRASKIFQTESGMEKPQFGFKGYDSNTFRELTFYFKQDFWSFECFFIADMFYLLSICWLIYTLYKKIEPRDSILGDARHWFPNILISVGAIAVVADIMENLSYLTGNLWFSYLETIKLMSIGLFAIVFLMYVYFNSDSTKYDKMRKFVRSAYISIIILVLIGFGLTLLPQGATLIVHLFNAHSVPGLISIVFSVFFINMLAVMLSHYPKYIEFRQDKDKKDVFWHMKEQFYGLGIITYRMKKPDDPHLVLGRYILGILAYVAWFYIIYKAFALYGLTLFEPLPATALCGCLYLLAAGYFYFKFLKDKAIFWAKVHNRVIIEEDIEPMRKWVRWYIYSLLGTIIFGTISLFIYWHFGWHTVSYVFSLIFIFFNASCFLLFRFTRSSMTYTGGNLEHMLWVNRNDYASEESTTFLSSTFAESRNWQFILKGRIWKFFADFSSNYIFLRRLQIAGYVAILFLLFSNVIMIFADVTILSGIPIFLAFLVNIYAIIILYVKHMIFYNDYENENYFLHRRTKKPPGIDLTGIQVPKVRRNRFVLVLAIVPFIGIGVYLGVKSINNFHKMDFTETKTSMRIQEYSHELERHIEKKNIKKLVKVASFGGGLKSNLWNLLVLNQMEAEMEKRALPNAFLDHCFSFSGVSGGAVGLGNYLAMDYSARNYDLDKWKAIEDIGNENILSIDIAGIFIHDSFFNFFKFSNSRNKDRSYYAMERYIKILSNGNKEFRSMFSDSSQQYVWHKMYKDRGHIPALIINTASTGPFPGVAFSLETKYLNYSENEVFPGYILLEDLDKDLRYYDAISTSNRFPIMSPTAQVDEKGFFLDGGYFENSGLLTSSYFQKFLRSNSPKLNETPVLTINVINSKSDYIRNFLGDLYDDNIIINSSSNISAIISGISDINKLPNVLRRAEDRYPKNGDELMSIYLPHLITTADIETMLGGRVYFTPEVLEAIQKNNKDIRQAIIDYAAEYDDDVDVIIHGIVEPPLARTLSKYAVIYQQAMITQFEGTQQEIKEIVDWLEQ